MAEDFDQKKETRGASFKDLGKKCFCLSKIENDNVLKELLKIVNS